MQWVFILCICTCRKHEVIPTSSGGNDTYFQWEKERVEHNNKISYSISGRRIDLSYFVPNRCFYVHPPLPQRDGRSPIRSTRHSKIRTTVTTYTVFTSTVLQSHGIQSLSNTMNAKEEKKKKVTYWCSTTVFSFMGPDCFNNWQSALKYSLACL